MGTYTADQVRRICEGLTSGRRPRHIPMTDDEFLAVYDPQLYESRLLRKAMEDMVYAVSRLSPDSLAQPERPWRPARSAPPVRPLSGPIDVP